MYLVFMIPYDLSVVFSLSVWQHRAKGLLMDTSLQLTLYIIEY